MFQIKLFSTWSRYIRLQLQSKVRWTAFQSPDMVFDLREVPMWGHPLQ